MAGYRPSFLFVWLYDRDKVEVHELTKKEQGQYPVILAEQTCSIKDLLYGFRRNFSFVMQRIVLSGQDQYILTSQSQCMIWFILPTHRASHIINIIMKLYISL